MQMMSPGTLSLEEAKQTVRLILQSAQDHSIWWGHDKGRMELEDLKTLGREMELVLASQSKNAVIGKVKTSPNGILKCRTSGLYKK